MRKLELKVVQVIEHNQPLDYREEFLQAMKFSLEGLKADQMDLPLKVIPRLKLAKDSIVLEEEEWKYLCNILNNTKYRIVAQEIQDMVRYVNAAEEVDLNNLKVASA